MKIAVSRVDVRILRAMYVAMFGLATACSTPRPYMGGGDTGVGGGRAAGNSGHAGAMGSSGGSGGLPAAGTGGSAAAGGEAGHTGGSGTAGAGGLQDGTGGMVTGAGGNVGSGTGGSGSGGRTGTGGSVGNPGGAGGILLGTGGASGGVGGRSLGTGGGSGSGGVMGSGGAGGAQAISCSPACVAPSGGVAQCVAGTCMSSCSTTGQTICDTSCVDKSTDKNNCGACGTTCEGYQYCSAGKCVPHYEWTRVMPSMPSGAVPPVTGSAVASNGDVVIETLVESATVTFSTPQESSQSVSAANGVNKIALARLSSTNQLKWGSDFGTVLANGLQDIDPLRVTPLALTSGGDIALGYLKADPSPATSSHYRLGVVSGVNPTLSWEATYPTGQGPSIVLPRELDIVTLGTSATFGMPVAARVPNGGGTPAIAGNLVGVGGVLGADASTVWLWGTVNAGVAAALNPWSAQMWAAPAGASGFVIGARDNGQQSGPWFCTSSDNGFLAQTSQIIPDQQNNIILYATQGGSSSGSLTLNGKEIARTGGHYGLSKINGSTGDVIWKRDVDSLNFVVVTPDGEILTVTAGAASYSANIYSEIDGHSLASFVGSGQAMQVAPGGGSVYVIGGALVASDFDPGTRTDIQGGISGLFVSRFSY